MSEPDAPPRDTREVNPATGEALTVDGAPLRAMIRLSRIGSVQSAALWQECLESIHGENGDEFPGELVDDVLTIEPGAEDRAEELLRAAVESCEVSGDREYRNALAAVLKRLEAARAVKVAPMSAADARAAREAALAAWRADPTPETESRLRAAHGVMVAASDLSSLALKL